MKTCNKCHKTKEDTEFPKHKNGKDGLNSYCRECLKEYKANKVLSNKELGLCSDCSNPAVTGKTRCIKCAEVNRAYAQRNKESLKEYKANKVLSHKELGLCVRCSNPAVIGRVLCTKCIEVQKAYRQRNKERRKEYHKEYKDRRNTLRRLRRYNLTEEQYNELLTQQDCKCAICKDIMTKPCVDHCHSTGKVRGLLCSNCNAAIGLLKDSPELLMAATKYVSL